MLVRSAVMRQESRGDARRLQHGNTFPDRLAICFCSVAAPDGDLAARHAGLFIAVHGSASSQARGRLQLSCRPKHPWRAEERSDSQCGEPFNVSRSRYYPELSLPIPARLVSRVALKSSAKDRKHSFVWCECFHCNCESKAFSSQRISVKNHKSQR